MTNFADAYTVSLMPTTHRTFRLVKRTLRWDKEERKWTTDEHIVKSGMSWSIGCITHERYAESARRAGRSPEDYALEMEPRQ